MLCLQFLIVIGRLVYPCDPEAPLWTAPMERTKPEWPGALNQGLEVPLDPDVARIFMLSRSSDGLTSLMIYTGFIG
jgi:hypothetical protein